MLPAPVRLGLAASALVTLLVLPQAVALGPSLPGEPLGSAAGATPVVTPVASQALVSELAGQALKELGVPAEHAFRLADRAIGFASSPDASRQMNFLAQDAAALSGADAAAARDVFARIEGATTGDGALISMLGRRAPELRHLRRWFGPIVSELDGPSQLLGGWFASSAGGALFVAAHPLEPVYRYIEVGLES